MRYIGIIILLVLCLTLLLLTGCIVNPVIPETAIGNLGNQENTEEPVIENTEEPVIENTEEPAKWSGLGMGLFSTANTSEFDGYVDDLLANGFNELRMNTDWYNWNTKTVDQFEIISAITKGAYIIWGVESGGRTLTSSNWDDYADAVLDAAQWAQDNGVYEFQIGNEEEYHIDGTTMTIAQIITNLKSVATDVQAVFTRGNVSYTCGQLNIYDWVSAGKGDLDILASNIYRVTAVERPWMDYIDSLVATFGPTGTAITEFGPDANGLDYWSTDEAVQTTAVTEMIEYIKASGITRAFYFCYRDPSWLSGFGARKDDGTYRLLWNQALLNSGSVKSTTVTKKTTTISLPDTIALIPK